MTMLARNWRTVAVAALAFGVGVLVAGGGLLRRAEAQSEGQTSGVICVVGAPSAQIAPIVLVDVPDQTMVVYRFDYRSDQIELSSARSYRFDKLLQDFNTKGATVEDVRRAVTGQ
jgi:hypothetical protein